MGTAFSSLFNRLFGNKQMRILMVGLDAVGKTTILYKLKLGVVVTTIPTIGFNVETVNHNNVSFTMWDTNSAGKLRPLLRHYYPNTRGIVFVVDANDRDKSRITEAQEEIQRMMDEKELKEVAVLIFANKQDLPNAMSVEELTDKLSLSKYHGRKMYIQASSATQGYGLYEGLDWLSNVLTDE